jgi:hypothetical protein
MGKVFRTGGGESRILSKIESSKERARQLAVQQAKDLAAPLGNAVAMKLIEDKLIRTTSKGDIEAQIESAIEKLAYADEFDVEYQIAPFRNLVPRPHIVSLYLTAFVVEKLINHRSVEDIYGSDEEIYNCIHRQVARTLLQ